MGHGEHVCNLEVLVSNLYHCDRRRPCNVSVVAHTPGVPKVLTYRHLLGCRAASCDKPGKSLAHFQDRAAGLLSILAALASVEVAEAPPVVAMASVVMMPAVSVVMMPVAVRTCVGAPMATAPTAMEPSFLILVLRR